MTGMTALSSPVALPFSLADLRRRKYLQLAGVAPERLYRRFAPEPDPDVVAREYLGLSRETSELVDDARGRRGRRQGLLRDSTGPASPRCKPVERVPDGDRPDRPASWRSCCSADLSATADRRARDRSERVTGVRLLR